MIDFTLTENDEARLARIYAEGEYVRKFVRDSDENEQELPPETLPGADDFLKTLERPEAPGADDTQGPAMMTLTAIAQYWGDYSLRLKRAGGGGLGNAALSAAGTDEQKAKWGGLLLSMAITEPGCGSDPSRVETTADLDEETNEWVLNGEKIFVTTGIRAEGVVIWATIDKSRRPRRHQELPRREGYARLRGSRQGEEARHPLRRHGRLRVHATVGSRVRTCSGSTSRSRRAPRAASAAS